MRVLFSALALLAVSACASLSDRARDSLEQPGLEGTRFGLVVMTMNGRELVSIRPDERFLPASNTKLFTAAAAFHRLGDMTQPDPARGTSLRLVPHADGQPDLVLVGAGDPTLIDSPDCERNCLSDLADAVVAQNIVEAGSILVDTSLYPYELWPPGWSHEDRFTRSGAPISAIVINSNEARLIVSPGAAVGEAAVVTLSEDNGTFVVASEVVTVAEESTPDDIFVDRYDGSPVVRVVGRIALASEPVRRVVAVDESALAAAMQLAARLGERGVQVGHGVHQILRNRVASDVPPEPMPESRGIEIARLIPPPLIENVTFLMKRSQNLHTELLLRRIGLLEGDGSREAGLAIIEAMLNEAGIPRWTWDFSDGSGMSVYNRLTPQATVDFLRWTNRQPWGEAFRDTLPIGGIDGTLRRRFAGTSLEGRIFAKTGTLRGTNALSGFMMTKSGQMLVFSAFANERPSAADSAIAALDATLVAISETN